MTSTARPTDCTRAWVGGAVLALTVLSPVASQQLARPPVRTNYQVLYAFPIQYGHPGSNPYAYVISDSAGNLYGTTLTGGQGEKTGCPCGVVFKLDAKNKESVVYNFDGIPDGAGPWAGLIRDTHGTLYGTTTSGGASGWGMIFKVDRKGRETVLHSFSGSDGAYPASAVVMDTSGNLFGTTMGCNGPCGDTWGEVFKFDQTGNLTVLHQFTGGNDGGIAQTGLILDPNGSTLYGATLGGGASGSAGVAYSIDTSGCCFNVLYSFSGGADGNGPAQGHLIEDATGNLYGTTQLGGDMTKCGGNGCGAVFEIDAKGNETVLYSFKGGVDWGHPNMPLVRDARGNLFGTTYYGGGHRNCGGVAGCGTVFEVDISGKEIVLHKFSSGSDGANPLQGLIADTSGNLYGTTQWGGKATIQCGNTTTGCGTVFKLALGLRLERARSRRAN